MNEIKTIDDLKQSQALTQRKERPIGLDIFTDINAFEEAQRVAKALMSADVCPTQYRQSVGNTLIALELSQRTKASVLAVMQSLVVVHGRPTWESKFLIGCVNTSGKFSPLRYEMFGEEGQDSWGCRAWAYDLRTDEKLIGPKVTVAMAKAEGWYNRKSRDGRPASKWPTMTELMLRYRSASFWVRQFAPEISLGMQTSEEAYEVYEAEKAETGDYVVDLPDLNEPTKVDLPSAAGDTVTFKRPNNLFRPQTKEGAYNQDEVMPEKKTKITEDEVFPKKVGEGPTDWIDRSGVPFNADVFGWNDKTGLPSSKDGYFRARRGMKNKAAQYRAEHLQQKKNPAAVVDPAETVEPKPEPMRMQDTAYERTHHEPTMAQVRRQDSADGRSQSEAFDPSSRIDGHITRRYPEQPLQAQGDDRRQSKPYPHQNDMSAGESDAQWHKEYTEASQGDDGEDDIFGNLD